MLRVFVAVVAGGNALCAGQAEDPFLLAEEQFLLQLNSLDGIEVAGGPFHVTERYTFSGVSGYFVLAPETLVAGLDQRLTVQTRLLDPAERKLPKLPLSAPPFHSEIVLSAAGRAALLTNIARIGFGENRSEVTLFENGSIQTRPVLQVPIVTVRPLDANRVAVLLGAAPWQGVPLVKLGLDRVRGNGDLEFLHVGFTRRTAHELQLRGMPLFNPQTFWAQGALQAAEWKKLLARVAEVGDLPPEIVDAQVHDDELVLSLDYRRPQVPMACAAFHQENSAWKADWAVETRAQFPQPAAWWCFLPFLERPSGSAVERLAKSVASEMALSDGRELIETTLRLRGVGEPVSVRIHGADAVVKTACTLSRGYELQFSRVGGKWRLSGFAETGS